MKWFTALLLVGVFVRHDAVNLIAGWVDMTPAAVFYILGGFWEAILCGVIFLIAIHAKPSIWRVLLEIAMAIGILEGLEVSVCRIGITDIYAVPAGVNLCDYLTGFPVGKALMAVYFLITVWSVGRATRAS